MEVFIVIIFVLLFPVLAVWAGVYVPLKNRIEGLEDRIGCLEDELDKAQEKRAPQQVAQQTPPPIPVEEPQVVVGQPVAEPVKPAVPKEDPQPVYQETPVVEPVEQEPRNWERFIGQNLLGKIGILVLVLGVGYFVKYAIDNNWINELARTIMGLLVGLVLMGIAHRLRNRYRAFSSLLAGGGYAVMFTTVAVAYNYYRLFTPFMALNLLVGFTVAMAAIALIFDRRELASTALLGGFLAPFLISTDHPQITTLLIYVAVLDGGMAAIAVGKRWLEMPLIAFVATYYIHSFVPIGGSATYLAFASTYYVLLMVPMVLQFRHGLQHNNPGWFKVVETLLLVALVLNNFIYLGKAHDIYPEANGAIAASLAVVNGLIWFFLHKRQCSELLQTIELALAVTFITIAVPLQWGATTIVIIWAAEMVVLKWVAVKTRSMVVDALSAVMLVVTLIAVFFVGTDVHGLSLRNEQLTTGLFASACYLGYYLLMEHCRDKSKNVVPYSAIVLAIAAGLCYYVVRRETDELFTVAYIALLSALLPFKYGVDKHNWLYQLFLLVLLFIPFSWYSDHFVDPKEMPLARMWTGLAMTIAACVEIGWLHYGKSAVYKRLNLAEASMGYHGIVASTLWLAVWLYGFVAMGWTASDGIALSLSLTTAGFVLMGVGMRRHKKVLRIDSLALLGIVLAKLLINDVWNMSALGKIIVFTLLGVLLLILSFLYQRLKSTLFSDEGE